MRSPPHSAHSSDVEKPAENSPPPHHPAVYSYVWQMHQSKRSHISSNITTEHHTCSVPIRMALNQTHVCTHILYALDQRVSIFNRHDECGEFFVAYSVRVFICSCVCAHMFKYNVMLVISCVLASDNRFPTTHMLPLCSTHTHTHYYVELREKYRLLVYMSIKCARLSKHICIWYLGGNGFNWRTGYASAPTFSPFMDESRSADLHTF